jgi:hypothetical protein
MAWTDSHVFRAAVADVFGNVTAMDFDADSFKVALYNNTITPDNDVSSANSAYNVGQWATAQEVFQAGQWNQAGVVLTGQSLNSATADTVFFDANDTSSGAAATLAAVFGCLVYDDTLAAPVVDQGASFNYFGGTNSVTNGTFTVVWHANGIWRATM